MAYNAIPKGNPYWALVLAFSVAVAALLFGLWLVSPDSLNKYIRRQPSAVAPVPPPPPPPPLPALLQPY